MISKQLSPLSSLENVRSDVESVLAEFCQRQTVLAATMSPDYERLWKELSAYLAAGGKRLRPYLVVMAYEASGGQDAAAIRRVGAAWEMLHAALLIHDDIMDRSYIRHGRPNIAGSYRKIYEGSAPLDTGHLADSAALLAGDLALSSSYQLIITSGLSPARLEWTLGRFGAVIAQVGGGQLLDSEAVLVPADEVAIETINTYKTALYSFGEPLMMGAWLGGANQDVLDGLRDFGIAVGQGYQLADDLLGTFGDDARTGKPIDSDIREGKRTVLMKYAYQRAEPGQRELLDRLVGNPDLDDAGLQSVRQVLEASGAKQAVEADLEHAASRAQAILDSLEWTEVGREALTDLVRLALRRER